MVATVGSIAIDLSANTAKFIAGFKQSATTVERESARMAKSIQSIERSVSGLSFGVRGLVGGAVAREIVQYADAWTLAGNKIRAAGESAGVEVRSLEALNDIANRNRSSLQDTVDLYAKLIRSTEGVAKSEKEVAEATEIVTRAFKAGGAAAHEQTAGILQLGQALSSGLLQGDELRSIRENAPLLAKAIAEEFGVTIGKLKELGSQGVITSDRVFKAILNGRVAIDEQFAKTNSTIGDSFTRLQNSLLQMGGAFDTITGFSEQAVIQVNNLAAAIENAPDVSWLETLANVMGASLDEGGFADTIRDAFFGAEESVKGLTEGIKQAEAALYEAQVTFDNLKETGATPLRLEIEQEELDEARAKVEELRARLQQKMVLDVDASEIDSAAAGAPRALRLFREQLPASDSGGRRVDELRDIGGSVDDASDDISDSIGAAGRVIYDQSSDAERAAEDRAKEDRKAAAADRRRAAEAISAAVGQAADDTIMYWEDCTKIITGRFDDSIRRQTDALRDQLITISGSIHEALLPGKYSAAMANEVLANRSTSGSWAGSRITARADSGLVKGANSRLIGAYASLVGHDMPGAAAITESGGGGAINVNVVVKPVLEGQRLSAQSTAEIKQAASAGANAALRAFNGR